MGVANNGGAGVEHGVGGRRAGTEQRAAFVGCSKSAESVIFFRSRNT